MESPAVCAVLLLLEGWRILPSSVVGGGPPGQSLFSALELGLGWGLGVSWPRVAPWCSWGFRGTLGSPSWALDLLGWPPFRALSLLLASGLQAWRLC